MRRPRLFWVVNYDPLIGLADLRKRHAHSRNNALVLILHDATRHGILPSITWRDWRSDDKPRPVEGMTLSCWLVQLEGEQMDLEEVALHFAAEPMRAIKDGDKFCLCGRALNTLDDATAVRETAQSWLDEASTVISLLWPVFRKPGVGNVFRQHEDGRRDAWIFVHAGEIRFHASGKLTPVGPEGQQMPTVPVAVSMLNAARADRHLHRALLLWSDRPRSWPRLYVVIDELQNYVKGSLAAAGYCLPTELERFTRTANNAEAAGLDARHAIDPKQQPPTNPMTLQEAENLVQRIMSEVLRRAAGLR